MRTPDSHRTSAPSRADKAPAPWLLTRSCHTMAVVARHVTMRHTKLVLFMALIVAADAAIPVDWDGSGLDVKVFTKASSPFSEKGDDCTGAPELEAPCKARGFSHEFVDKLLEVAFPGKLITKTTIFVKEAHNDGIFEHIRSEECINGTTTSTDWADHGQTKKLLCLGAASISITTEREKTMDFLPSYFESGLKVMVAGHTDPWQLITDVLRFSRTLSLSLSPSLLTSIHSLALTLPRPPPP